MLNSLCILGKISGASNSSDATDEAVKAWFQERLSFAPHDLAERTRAALARVTYKTCKDDSQGAVLTFVLDIVNALDRNNASDVIRDE